MPAYVFGYGSLVPDGGSGPPAAPVVHARGLRRTWDVAMDNRETVPGYKVYVDERTGERHAGLVVYLNLREDGDGAPVNGRLLAVDDDAVAAFDHRERNYARVDITARILEPVDGVVWAYLGLDAARERCAAGIDAGIAVVSRGYLERVDGGFAALGAAHHRRYAQTTDAVPCPVADLRRIDL